ncbi:hypothetical protein [Aurantiacibacter spongiae]|uniref:Uncharacterized protein n=1 Tax=Aurantiacibacter spongiae TaxID=2488860 RepID=A0A3N5CQ06_9SPHN|nr:hypothetical protein [Aurantiacibacter spongiae]RPF70456.1 hypothetical protein EG799_01535 [Aurantiacibacter spongiae]
MTELIPVKGVFLLGLLEEVGKRRALTDVETDLIEEIVRSEGDCSEFEWQPKHDQWLTEAARRKAIKRLALDMGVSEGAAYQRLARVRKRKGVKVRGNPQKGRS